MTANLDSTDTNKILRNDLLLVCTSVLLNSLITENVRT